MNDMQDIILPLTAHDCDLRDFPYMPLDVVRLRDSDLSAHSTGDEFRCAVLLWCASWHQVPAASLPDDDKVLAQLAGFGRAIKEWQKLRDAALRGWVKCSDGRLYHPVVAEKANAAYTEKLTFQYKKLCDRLRKSGLSAERIPNFDNWISSGKKEDFHWKESGIPKPIEPSSVGIPAEKALIGNVMEGKGNGIEEKELTLSASPPSRASAICIALKSEGIGSVNPSHPDLTALLADGAEVQEFVDAGRIARDKGKGFAYLLAIVRGNREEAKRLAKKASRTPPSKPSKHTGFAEKNYREGVEADGTFA